MTAAVLCQFGLIEKDHTVQQFGSGLINTTCIVENKSSGERFILQKINQAVFHSPTDIAHNIRMIADHLKQHNPEYLFVAPIRAITGQDLAISDGGFYRLFPFIKGSHTLDVVKNPGQAYEAAKQFGKFTRLLAGMDAGRLRITLPDFHNLSLRYQQFEKSLQKGNRERIKQSRDLIWFIQQNRHILGEFEFNRLDFKTRVIHHDTKISNVLFDSNDKGLCVIDLDTAMPGYFISDVGDMMRTYLSPVSEEEKDNSLIWIRPEFYTAIVEGYLSEMGDTLLDVEKKYFGFAGKFMIYMQAIRFLTDHLNNDEYYGCAYEGQNFIRAVNQATLLERLIEYE